MKNTGKAILAITLMGLAAGCKPSGPDVDSPSAGGTNLASAAQAFASVRNYAVSAATNTMVVSTQAWAAVRASLHSAANDTYEHKDAFVAKMKADLDILDQQIKDLNDQAVNSSAAARADLQVRLQELRAKRAVLDQKLAKVKDATEADWNEMKADFQGTCEDMENRIKDAWHALTTS